MSLNILIVEGNNRKDSEVFIKASGASASENLRNLILKLEPSINTKIINPDNDQETKNALENMDQYHGIIFTGGAMRINNMTDEIKKHINFASNCFKHDNKILAICWGLQVCSTAAGGRVEPSKKGPHIGIASDVIINEEGQKNLIYKNKKSTFTSPAFNYDEVVELPAGATLLSSDNVNHVMAIHFKPEKAEVWGLQYHPDYEYHQMVNLSAERKEQMLEKKRFEDEDAFNKHMDYIKEEEKKLEFKDRTCEVRNWLDFIKSQQN